MPRQKLDPVHPGEVLAEEFLRPLGLSQYRLAKDVSVPARRINEIVRGSRAVTSTRESGMTLIEAGRNSVALLTLLGQLILDLGGWLRRPRCRPWPSATSRST